MRFAALGRGRAASLLFSLVLLDGYAGSGPPLKLAYRLVGFARRVFFLPGPFLPGHDPEAFFPFRKLDASFFRHQNVAFLLSFSSPFSKGSRLRGDPSSTVGREAFPLPARGHFSFLNSPWILRKLPPFSEGNRRFLQQEQAFFSLVSAMRSHFGRSGGSLSDRETLLRSMHSKARFRSCARPLQDSALRPPSSFAPVAASEGTQIETTPPTPSGDLWDCSLSHKADLPFPRSGPLIMPSLSPSSVRIKV